MKKLNHKGFSAVEALLILVIIGILGGAGWFVYNSQKKADESLNKAGQTQSESQKPAEPKAVRTTYSKVPAELQEAILARFKERVPACVKGDQIIDNGGKPSDINIDYAQSGSAIVTVGCDGGSATLFAKNKSGVWIYIDSTQFAFKCSDLTGNKVPKELLQLDVGAPAAECFDKTDETVKYQGV